MIPRISELAENRNTKPPISIDAKNTLRPQKAPFELS